MVERNDNLLEIGEEILIRASSVEEAAAIFAKHFPSPDDNDVLSKSEVPGFLKISPRTLDYLIAADLIPYKRANPNPGEKGHRTLLFSKRQLLAWIEREEEEQSDE